MPRPVPRTGPRGHRYVLTVSCAPPRGIVEHVPDSHDYAAGTRVVLTAIPDENYKFEGWEGDLSGAANPEAVMMFDDKTVTARFERL